MIDQDIQDALNVHPSPEFLARVRVRIANEPEPSSWRWRWIFVPAAAVAATIIVAIMLKPAPQLQVAQGFDPAVPGVIAPPPREAAAPAAPVRTTRLAKTVALPVGVALPVVSGSSRTSAPEPEALLDARETRALRALIAGVRDGRVDLAAVQNSVTPEPMTLPPITAIKIPLIVIEPMTPVAGAEGVRP